MTRWDRGNLPVVSVVVTRPLMVCVSPVNGLVAVPLHVVVRGDFPVFVRVRAIEHGTPALGWGVVVADQVRVGIQIHALGPD